MRNLIYTIAIIVFYSNGLFAQFFQNKTKVWINYDIVNTLNSSSIDIDGVEFLNVEPNLDNVFSMSVGFMQFFRPKISYGLEFRKTNYTNWNKSNIVAQADNTLEKNIINVNIYYHNAYEDHGIYNRLQYGVGVGPVLEFEKYSFNKVPVNIYEELEPPVSETNFNFGISTSLFVAYRLSKWLEVNFMQSFQVIHKQSNYSNALLTNSITSFGLVFSFNKIYSYE